MSQASSDPDVIWRAIQQAGSVDGYVTQQLKEGGFLVDRRDASSLSKRELAAYKKELKAEAAERRRLKKIAWQSYKDNHIVHLGDHIFWNDGLDWDKWDLENAEERAAENELPALDSPAQLAEKLDVPVRELRWLAYHREAATMLHYRRFTIPKRDGSERPIWAPLPKLKAAQHWILRNIVERLVVHGAAHGFLPGRSILSNASAHTDAQVVLKMDIRDFFPTITLPRVKGVFRKAGYREQIALLLALICTESPREIVERNDQRYFVALGPRCLPQGAPTSPGLTNTLCLRMDRRLSGLAKSLGWRYTRYADDLTFSLPASHKKEPNLGRLIGLTKRTVADEGFEVHPEKTRVSRTGSRQKVTGLVINGDGTPRVPRQLKRQLRAAIHNAKAGKPLKEGESLETLRGYAAFIAMSEPELGQKYLADLAEIA